MVEVEVEDKPSQYLTSQSFQDVDFISSLPLLSRLKLSIFGPDNQIEILKNISKNYIKLAPDFYVYIFFLQSLHWFYLTSLVGEGYKQVYSGFPASSGRNF